MSFFKWLKRQKSKTAQRWRAFHRLNRHQCEAIHFSLQSLEPRVLLSAADTVSTDLVTFTQAISVPPVQASLTGELDLNSIYSSSSEAGALFVGVPREHITQYDHTGYNVSSAGDVNADGYDDFLISAFGADSELTGVGKVYLVYGREDLYLNQQQLANIGSVDLQGAVFHGIYNGGWGDLKTEKAGDVNGDGYDDILIASTFAEPNGEYSGQVYLIYGGDNTLTGDLLLSDLFTGQLAGAVFNGNAQWDAAGTSISGNGDVNGDGFDDILISAPNVKQDDQAVGQTYLIYGQSGGLSGEYDLSEIESDSLAGVVFIGLPNSSLGTSAAIIGDVNGDGYADMLISALNYDSENYENVHPLSYLIFGQQSGLEGLVEISDLPLSSLTYAELNIQFENQEGYLNQYNFSYIRVDAAGDVNGDGLSDMLLGAGYYSDSDGYAGPTYLIYGQQSGLVGSLDVNELAMDGASGAVFVEDIIDEHYSLATAGDVNGDGFDDILIGATPSYYWYPEDGMAYLVYGKTAGLTGSISLSAIALGTLGGVMFTGSPSTAHDLASAGDVNGDGLDDLIFGADDKGLMGSAYLLYGVGTSPSIQSSSIAGIVRLDHGNENDDLGVVNVQVNLRDIHGVLLQTTQTNGDGEYIFEYLPEGDYVIEVIVPDWAILYDACMGHSTIDAMGVNPKVYRSDPVCISDNEQCTGIDVEVVLDSNNAPQAVPNLVSTGYLTAVDIDVLSNDFDVDGDVLVVSQLLSATSRLGVQLTINSDNTIHYDPTSLFEILEPGQTVRDVFRYQVSDTGRRTDAHIVFVDVTRPLISETSNIVDQSVLNSFITTVSSLPRILANTSGIAIQSPVLAYSSVGQAALAWLSQQARMSIVSQYGLSQSVQQPWLSGLLGNNEKDSFRWSLKDQAVEENI